jgi:Arc/MetJ family transcription regulator
MSTTRTNIEIDDQLVEEAMRRYNLKTKREAVQLALNHLVGHPMRRDEIRATRGAGVFGEVPNEGYVWRDGKAVPE